MSGQSGLETVLDLSGLRAQIPTLLRLFIHTHKPLLELTMPVWQRDLVEAELRRVIPIVVPCQISSFESGSPLSGRALAALRASCKHLAAERIPLPTVMIGIGPSLETLTSALLVGDLDVHDGDRALVIARAGQLANQITLEQASIFTALKHGVESANSLESQDLRILTLAANGCDSNRIAQLTSYSTRAVTWRISQLMHRWGVPNRTALVAEAYRRGVLL